MSGRVAAFDVSGFVSGSGAWEKVELAGDAHDLFDDEAHEAHRVRDFRDLHEEYVDVEADVNVEIDAPLQPVAQVEPCERDRQIVRRQAEKVFVDDVVDVAAGEAGDCRPGRSRC